MSLFSNLLRLPHTNEPVANNVKAHLLMRAYERTFLDAQGKLTADARLIIAELYSECGMIHPSPMRKLDGSISVEDMCIAEGKRIMVLGIMRRIFKKALPLGGSSPEEDDQLANTLIEEYQGHTL